MDVAVSCFNCISPRSGVSTNGHRLQTIYSVFQAVRVFDPQYAKAGHVIPSAVDRLAVLPWLTPAIIANLQLELADYLVCVNASNLDFSHDNLTDFTTATLNFWKNEVSDAKCRTWKFEARRVLCLTPNSAASERVFSMLKAMFDTNQELSMSDYLEGSVMLAYNDRKVG